MLMNKTKLLIFSPKNCRYENNIIFIILILNFSFEEQYYIIYIINEYVWY